MSGQHPASTLCVCPHKVSVRIHSPAFLSALNVTPETCVYMFLNRSIRQMTGAWWQNMTYKLNPSCNKTVRPNGAFQGSLSKSFLFFSAFSSCPFLVLEATETSKVVVAADISGFLFLYMITRGLIIQTACSPAVLNIRRWKAARPFLPLPGIFACFPPIRCSVSGTGQKCVLRLSSANWRVRLSSLCRKNQG